MVANVGDWVGEITPTTGTGDIGMGGQIDGYAPFNTIPDGLVWYSIVDGSNRESGQGTLTGGGTFLERTIVSATLINNSYHPNPSTPLELSGLANVYCTFNKSAFDELNSAIDKLSGIEDGATADQTAEEVPYPNVDQDNVKSALDFLYQNLDTNINFVNMGGYTEIVLIGNSINASSFNVATISDGVTPVVISGVPNGSYTLTIMLTAASIDLSNLSIKWAGAEAPSFTVDIDLIFLTTIDGGSTWLGSASLGYA